MKKIALPMNARNLVWLCSLFLISQSARAGAADADEKEPTTQTAVNDKRATTSPDWRDFSTATATPTTAVAGSGLFDMGLEELMNIEVTSVSKKKEPIANAPAAVTVIDQDTIARSGFSTIPDLLRLAPGMDVARINSYSWAISARGFNNQFADKLLVLQDGRTLYSPTDGGVFWDTVDYVLEDLQRIEVIRGPGTTLWGSNAVNGVVNITSKDAQDTQGWLVSGRGSNDDSNMEARYGGKISDDTFYRVYFKGKYDNELPETGLTVPNPHEADNWYSARSGFRIDKHASDNDTFTVQGDLANNQLRVPSTTSAPTPPFFANKVFNGSDATGNVLGRWNHRVDDDSNFSLQVYYDYLKIEQGIVDFDQHTIDLDFNHRFMVGKRNEVSWGAGYRIVQMNEASTDESSISPSTQTKNLFSVYVQDKITIEPDRLFLTVGSKVEHNDFTGFEYEPSARLLWTPDKQNSLWAAISRATRSPSSVDRGITSTVDRFAIPNGTGGFVPAAVTINGDPNFASEKMISYELGYKVQATEWMSIDISTFYNDYNRVESVEPGAPQPGPTVIIPSTFANGVRGDTYGGAISTNVQITEMWHLAGSYSLLQSTFEPATGFTDPTSSKALMGSSPRNQAQLHSYLDITKRLHFNAGIYFTDRVPEFNVPAFVSTDLNVMWEPKDGMQATIGVMNLFDNHHPEFGVFGNNNIADEVPRTLYAQVTYKF
ncbi:MAG TPA: TonB-dependent receptor [Tepidisphaeraceae bacterium]|nr:TonB-dependent receptor [Tepidisphaeraceae bacterium]